MADIENNIVKELPPEEQPQEKKIVAVGKSILSAMKEWGRKQIVILKRSPQRIPLLILVITSLLWLFWLFTFSQAVYNSQQIKWTGIAVFVNTMLSILILPLFLNAFPKRKKTNYVFIALVFVFMICIVFLDILYYIQSYDFVYVQGQMDEVWLNRNPAFVQSLNLSIVHIVLIGVSALALALLPVYAPMIKKINTSKEVVGNDIHETIDVEDE